MRPEIAHWRCFWTWPFGHYWQPGLGCDGHPAYVCRDCPKAVSQFGDMDADVSPKRPGVAERRFYYGKWAYRYPATGGAHTNERMSKAIAVVRAAHAEMLRVLRKDSPT